LTLSFLIDSSSRAPAIEELYSEGPHLATQTFDIGDPNLNEEDSLGFSATANYASDSVKANATVYYTDFSDFIYQSATGEEDDDLPVFEYVQSDAEFFGVDLSVEVQLGELAGGQLSADVIMDFVSAELSNQNSNLPRIPADRLGLGLRWKTDDWTVRTKYLHVDDQNEVAPDELATDGYEDLSLFVSRALEVQGLDMEIFFHGKNLTDDEQRYHASFVKDTAPAPGRSLEAGVRVAF
ncbi:MAG: TonB-dependent receptor, partial [Pseudomonadota bacterium]